MEAIGSPALGDGPARPWLPGRRAEFAALAARIRSVGPAPSRTSPGGGALVIQGAPGSGKSTLLRAARGFAADAGLLVLATSGTPCPAAPPYAALRELLRPLMGAAGALPAAQRTALLTAFGEPAGPVPGPHLVALAALHLLGECAVGRPVFAAVDDLTWLDEPSFEAFAFLARRVGDDSVLLCATARSGPGERPPPAGSERLDLTALGPAAAREILAVTATGLTPAQRRRVLAAAGGNLLALAELPSFHRGVEDGDQQRWDSPTPLPERLEQVFAARLEGLSPPARDVVLVAAVAGTGRVLEILAAASALGGGVPVSAGDLGRAVDAGLLCVEEDRVRLRHTAARAGTFRAEPRSRRRAAHAALAGVFADPYRARWHRALAVEGFDDAVADELAAAHRIPLDRGSAALAVRTLEQAARLTSSPARRDRRLLLAADHSARASRPDLVHRLLSALTATTLDERECAWAAWLGERARVHGEGDAATPPRRCGRTGPGPERDDRARTARPPGLTPDGTRDDDTVLRLCAMAELVARVRDVPLADGDLSTADQNLSLADGDLSTADQDLSLALDLLLAAALRCRHAEAGAPVREHLVALATPLRGPACEPRLTATLALAQPVRQAAYVLGQLGDDRSALTKNVTDAEGLCLLGSAAHAVGDPVAAGDFLDRAESGLRAQGRLDLLPPVLATQVRVRLDVGDWHRAAEAADEVSRIAVETGQPADTAAALVDDALASALRGDDRAALRLAGRAEGACSGRDAGLAVRVGLARGIAACVAGRHGDAYEVLRGLFPKDDGSEDAGPEGQGLNRDRDRGLRAGHVGPDSESPGPDGGAACLESVGAVGFLADAAVRAARRDDAARVLASLARRTARSPAPLVRVHLRYAAAVLADDVEAETLFRRALGENLARWPWPRARAELAYGGWLARRHRSAEARPLLRSARVAFDRIGARPWSAAACEELALAGGRTATPDRGAASRPHLAAARALSPLEAHIARLAGQGLTDREVGAELFLSPRAVAAHVDRVLTKLALASRDELATAPAAPLG
ncbi:AAA family ATPase [Streptomyces sp. NPDC006711]|uniref:helix-turn-helix transcriptional regulator n=1 Tax=Streptomyces sp. NPDC006711 TaxID=3364762 RepID=UPI0036CAA511